MFPNSSNLGIRIRGCLKAILGFNSLHFINESGVSATWGYLGSKSKPEVSLVSVHCSDSWDNLHREKGSESEVFGYKFSTLDSGFITVGFVPNVGTFYTYLDSCFVCRQQNKSEKVPDSPLIWKLLIQCKRSLSRWRPNNISKPELTVFKHMHTTKILT